MKTLFLSLASILMLSLSGCTSDDSLMSDEEYNTYRTAAPEYGDPSGHIPQRPVNTGRF